MAPSGGTGSLMGFVRLDWLLPVISLLLL